MPEDSTSARSSDRRLIALHDLLCPERPTRIVDIGANPIEPPPYEALAALNLCEVWGFEPQDTAFQRLVAAKRDNETYLPYAVGDGREANLHICRGDGFSSLFRPSRDFINFMGRWPRAMRVEKVVEVQTRRLDDIDEIPEFDLLKIDIQGAETDVFENGVNKLKSAVAVISEVAAIPIYEDQPLLDAQMRALSKQGFSLHKFLFFKSLSAAGKTSPRLRQRRFKNQLVDGDAVFLKNVLALENQPTESLKHLALLADSVFRSIDIAVHALSHLVDRQVIHPTAIDDYLDFFPTELVLSREEVSLRR